MHVEVMDLGLMAYSACWNLQKNYVSELARDQQCPQKLLLVEHPDVYTFGRKTGTGSPPPYLPNAVTVERGGEATFHNPGQLVIYPILRLEGEGRDIHAYLRGLEALTIEALSRYSISAERKEGATGVWVGDGQRKIASIGVAVSHWITYHGLALNVCNDLTGFSKIHPCGFSHEVMTSMEKELGSAPSMPAIKKTFLDLFRAGDTLHLGPKGTGHANGVIEVPDLS